ncbi:glycosyltransferase family 2 protein [Hahella sp. CR1]|uniref:glycosyltransferase family 2 protein n=1 Tax=Hahella sp. CR1 TaxID=2992807 RepID=UPI0024412A17|nr:glycosyltransferase family 2 protein [Hahella sp. CR1]MDG9668253.1 glycosyltransferase family 2 protein [Hahella sp. CR1]
MYKDARVCVVVPCYNEETQIAKVIETMPGFVDGIVVIDDKSQDSTCKVVDALAKADSRVELIRHEVNQGVGGAIATGYKYARDNKYSVAVVMAGDGQMHPEDLPSILDPVVAGEVDYSKGNRLFSGDAWEMIPRVRYLGNSMLSLLTKIASGYWHVADSQSGYTAINLKALETIHWDEMYKTYGQPNDLLVRLNVYGFRVRDVPIKPVYGIGEKSGIKPLRMIPRLSLLITKLFFFRLLQKYIIRDFHPLVFFYALGLFLFPLGMLSGGYLFLYRIFLGSVEATSALFSVFLVIMGLQFLLFAMWFDMEANKDLK